MYNCCFFFIELAVQTANKVLRYSVTYVVEQIFDGMAVMRWITLQQDDFDRNLNRLIMTDTTPGFLLTGTSELKRVEFQYNENDIKTIGLLPHVLVPNV